MKKVFTLLCFLFIIFNSCKKDPAIKENNQNNTTTNVSTPSLTPTPPVYYSYFIDGRLVDIITNKPIPNKTVSIMEKVFDGEELYDECVLSVATDSSGKFKISTSTTQFSGVLVLGCDLMDDYYNGFRESFEPGTTHFGNIYVTPVLHICVKLNKIGVFNITDTLFLNIDNQKYFFLYNQQNDSIDLGIRRTDVWTGAKVLLNWDFKTPTSVTSNNDSTFCKANVKATYILNY